MGWSFLSESILMEYLGSHLSESFPHSDHFRVCVRVFFLATSTQAVARVFFVLAALGMSCQSLFFLIITSAMFCQIFFFFSIHQLNIIFTCYWLIPIDWPKTLTLINQLDLRLSQFMSESRVITSSHCIKIRRPLSCKFGDRETRTLTHTADRSLPW